MMEWMTIQYTMALVSYGEIKLVYYLWSSVDMGPAMMAKIITSKREVFH